MKTALLGVFSLTLASTFAMADAVQTPGNTSGSSGDSPRFEVSFEQIDADGDGVISKEEAASSGIDDEGFKHLDKNGDEQLSREELLGVSRNDDEAPGNYNPGNSEGRDVDPGPEERSNELSPSNP